MKMHNHAEHPEALMELREICDGLYRTFRDVHSWRSVVKGLGAGVDLAGQATRLNGLEERVHHIGKTLYDDALQGDTGRSRLELSYWCEVMVATSALANWAAKAHLELDQGIPYDGRERQQTLRLFLRSVKSARAVLKMLES